MFEFDPKFLALVDVILQIAVVAYNFLKVFHRLIGPVHRLILLGKFCVHLKIDYLEFKSNRHFD